MESIERMPHVSPRSEPQPPRPSVPWGWKDALGVFILMLLVSVGASILVGMLAEAGLLPLRLGRALLLPLSQILLGTLALVYVAARFPGGARLLVGQSRPGAGAVGIGIGLGIAAFVLQALLGALLEQFSRLPLQEEVQPLLKEALRDPELRPFVMVTALVLAPVAEELFFRGMLYQALRDRLGRRAGMALSATFFAMLHLNPAAPVAVMVVLFGSILLLGLVLAWVFERKGTLLAPIALHATFNLLGVLVILALPQGG